MAERSMRSGRGEVRAFAYPLTLASVLVSAQAYADVPPGASTDYTPAPAAEPATATPHGDPPPAPPSADWLTPRCAGFLTAGVALVGIGIGTAYGVMALNSKSAFDQNPTAAGVVGANTGNQQAVISDVGFGVAVIAGATSIFLFLKGGEAPPPQSAPPPAPKESAVSFSVAPMVSSHGGGAGAILRF